jgi:transposase
MKLHRNAALSVQGRRRLARRVLEEAWTVTAAAKAAGVSLPCARKWIRRFQIEGESGLADRSSAPHTVANRTPEDRVGAIVALRKLRMTGAEIAEALRMPLSTVSAVLRRQGLGRLGRIGLEPAARYERSRPGELVHLDIKKLGRIEGGAGKRWRDDGRRHFTRRRRDAAGVDRHTIGWEFVHVAVDDYSRLAYAEVLHDEKAVTAAGFLTRRYVLRALRHHGRARDQRQRRCVPLNDPRGRMPPPRNQTPPHTPLPTPNQRQGRTLHPHAHRRLGLRSDLPNQQRTHTRP